MYGNIIPEFTKMCIAMLGVIVIAVAVAYTTSTTLAAEKIYSTGHTVELASMSNATEVSSRGGGAASIYVMRSSEDQVLRYVTRDTEGAYRMETIDTEKVSLREIPDDAQDTDDATPRIEFQQCQRVSDTDRKQSLLKSWNLDECSPEKGHTAVLHVPAGTISTDFALDPATS